MLLVSSMLGIFSLSMLKYIAQQSLMATFEQRALLYSSGQSSIFILFVGILLILPGILSDTIGLLMIIIGLGMYVSKRHLGFVGKNSGKNNKDDDVIDVEIIEHNDNFNSKREE